MDIQIGKITHYYDKIGVGVVVVSSELKTGDTIHILGDETEFTQVVTSMETEHEKVESVSKGTEVPIKLRGPARKGDFIYMEGAPFIRTSRMLLTREPSLIG